MIEIKITGETAEEIKAQFNDLTGGGESAPAKQTATRTRTKKEPTKSEDEDEAPKKKPAAKDTDEVTIDDIREAMGKKREEDEDNAEAMKGILKKYGAAKVSDLEEDDYTAVLKAINRL